MINDSESIDPTEPPDENASDPASVEFTVTDWHGQEVDRDIEAADDALALADGDEAAAESIFEDIRPEHSSDQFKVPANQREGTLVDASGDSDEADAVTG